jgi:predicted small integral membrane protein
MESTPLNNLTTDQLIRYSKVILMAFFSFFGLLVMFSNFTDYTSNYEYVGHILSMDTTRENANISYRAITSPIIHHRIYWIIITLEVMYTAYCLMGTYQLFKNLHAPAAVFHEAKKLAIIGLLIAIFIYYICLQVVGVEWFNMDESPLWNAKDWARHIVDFIFPLLIYLVIKIEH